MLRQSIPTLQAGRTATAIYSDKGELLVEQPPPVTRGAVGAE